MSSVPAPLRSSHPAVDHQGFLASFALYAAMVYGILRLLSTPAASAVWATVAMTAIELFQLTMIPARMLAGEHWMTRICARLLGVEFSFLDLLAYGVGIGCIYLVDSSLRNKPAVFRITSGGS